MERHLRPLAVESIVTDTFNCHHSGSTRLQWGQVSLGYSQPVIEHGRILVLAHSDGALDSSSGQVWLGNSYFSGWDFPRVGYIVVWDSTCLIFILTPLFSQMYQNSVACSMKASSAYTFPSLQLFFQQVSWKADSILVSAYQMNWLNTATLNITL